MSTKHERTHEAIFAHPISMNLHWRDVEHLLESLGGVLEPAHGGRVKVHLNGEEHTFHVPHTKTLSSREEVVQLRHFLERAGAAPAADKG